MQVHDVLWWIRFVEYLKLGSYHWEIILANYMKWIINPQANIRTLSATMVNLDQVSGSVEIRLLQLPGVARECKLVKNNLDSQEPLWVGDQ